MASSLHDVSLTSCATISSDSAALSTVQKPLPAGEPTSEDIAKKEWKYTGYKEFSKFISSDNDFFILRRFGALSARVILDLQDQLSILESDLLAIDQRLSSKNSDDIHNGSFRRERGSERWKLIQMITTRLKEYNDIVLQHSQLRARPPVPQKDIRSVENWLYNHRAAIDDQEAGYIKHTSDLFPIVPKMRSPLRRTLERSPQFRIFPLWREERPDLESRDQQHELYMSDTSIDTFITIIVTTSGLAMLIAPLWILEYVNDSSTKLVIITGFIVLFLALVSFATVAKPFETLGATAAYTAVLMVFLQTSGH